MTGGMGPMLAEFSAGEWALVRRNKQIWFMGKIKRGKGSYVKTKNTHRWQLWQEGVIGDLLT